jgi:hypothetical protein
VLKIPKDTGGFLHVFIAATTEVTDYDLIRPQLAGTLHGVGDSVRGLEGRHDPFD